MKNKILYIIFILFGSLCVAESPENINPNELRFREIVATRTSMMPIIDGIIDDEVWKTAMTEYDFIQFRPYNLAAPSERTEVRVIYDNDYMYVAINNFDTEPGKIIGRQAGETVGWKLLGLIQIG